MSIYILKNLEFTPIDDISGLLETKFKRVALFIPNLTNPFFEELSIAVGEIAQNNDYELLVCDINDDIKMERTYLDILIEKPIKGIIFATRTITSEILNEVNIPFTILDGKIDYPASSVSVNNYQGSRDAVRYLKSTGCNRIAYICGPESEYTLERLRGYLTEVLKEKWFLSSYILSGDYDLEKSIQLTMDLLKKHPEVDAIFTANDVMGVGAIKAADRLDIKVPEELSIITFDGTILGETTTPTLTTMAQPIRDMGIMATELLIEQIKDRQAPIKVEELSVELIERGSTKKVEIQGITKASI